MKISAVLIAKNEEAVIGRVLESVKGLDEIIVVDTGSSDKTIEIAKTFTDKVFDDFTWCDDFSKARNHARAKATGDWILSIDCDEILHSVEEVRKAALTAEAVGFKAVDVTMISEDVNPQGLHQVFLFPRLFKNCEEVWWVGAVHNHLSVMGEKIGDVKITFGYSPAHLQDPDRALRILEKEAENPENLRAFFYLGREYYYRDWYDKALVTFGKYVQRSRYLPEKAEAFLLMARCYWFLRMGDDARDACAQALIINAHFKEAIEFMGELSWPHNAEQWKRMAATAENKGVLFIRT